jgi:DNA-directed RNA polymerase specialized sigma24 family protein
LRYYEDLTLAEVSELLGCPLGTAKSLVHRGLENLRKEMRDDA